MHGGAAGSGASKGNTNALKDGNYTRAAIEARRTNKLQVREAIEIMEIILGRRRRPGGHGLCQLISKVLLDELDEEAAAVASQNRKRKRRTARISK